jgi:hypothetical protein
MDATRSRRTRDRARQQWYASHRQRRFARFMGVVDPGRTPSPTSLRVMALQLTQRAA